jgi:hypothetical protein
MRYNKSMRIKNMKTLMGLMVLGLMVFSGCDAGGGAAGGSGGGSGVSAAAAVIQDTSFHTYTFEVTGNGITLSTTLNGFDDFNYMGVQSTTINDPNRVYGPATVTFTVVAKSVNGLFKYNAGPGLINVTTKKDGVVIRNDNLILNGAQAIITIPN